MERSKGSGIIGSRGGKKGHPRPEYFRLRGIQQPQAASTYSQYHGAGVLSAKQPRPVSPFSSPHATVHRPSTHPMLHRTELGAGFISHQSILTHPCLLEGHQKARIERQAKSSLGSVTFRGITHRPDSAISSHFHLISPDSRLTSAGSLPRNTTKPKALLPSPPEGNRNPSSTHTHPPQGHTIRIVTLPCMNTHRHRHTDKRLVQASQPPPPPSSQSIPKDRASRICRTVPRVGSAGTGTWHVRGSREGRSGNTRHTYIHTSYWVCM